MPDVEIATLWLQAAFAIFSVLLFQASCRLLNAGESKQSAKALATVNSISDKLATLFE
jgi:hypothetical protein